MYHGYDGPRGYDCLTQRPISSLRLPLDVVSSVEALNVYISVRSCVDRARDADVHWCTTSATSATHQQIDTLTIILFTEVIRVAARNISVSYIRFGRDHGLLGGGSPREPWPSSM